jgi:hypothetical protein
VLVAAVTAGRDVTVVNRDHRVAARSISANATRSMRSTARATARYTCPSHFPTQDFVLGALVRVLGPEQFKTSDPRVEDQIGYALPWWSDAVRAELLAQVRAR